MKLTSIDLFCGAGGLSEGLRLSGFKSIYASEIEKAYANTYQENHQNSEICVDDIRSVSPKDTRKRLCLAKGELDLLAGGPPCQGYSINAPIRSTDDHRNHLFLSFIDFVKEFEPKAVLIENVPGIVSFNKGQVVNDILETLTALGYKSDVRILYAAHYGIPQMRWRTFFIGLKEGSPTACYPEPICSPPCRANFTTKIKGQSLIYDRVHSGENFVNVFDAIGDLPVIQNGSGDEIQRYGEEHASSYASMLRNEKGIIHNHKCAKISKINLERLSFIEPGGSWRDIPFDLLPKGLKRARRSDHTKRYGRLDPTGLASTILTKCDPHWGSFFHYSQDRVISVREAARLQAFPDSYTFTGSLTEQYKQVGNAVPPLLAKAIGTNIYRSITNQPLDCKWSHNSEKQLCLPLQ